MSDEIGPRKSLKTKGLDRSKGYAYNSAMKEAPSNALNALLLNVVEAWETDVGPTFTQSERAFVIAHALHGICLDRPMVHAALGLQFESDFNRPLVGDDYRFQE